MFIATNARLTKEITECGTFDAKLHATITDAQESGNSMRKRKEQTMIEYSVGEYIIYQNGNKYELGRIKSIKDDGAFVAYHEGETGAKTPFSHMHKLINKHCIKETTLGGGYFERME
jgi:hypothetical protein